MVIPRLFRNKNKDYFIYAVNVDHDVIWCRLAHDKLEPETRSSKVEFEDMLYNQGWEQDMNTPITIHGDKVITNNFLGQQEGHDASRVSIDD
jgi:hypothetical protein